MHHHQDDLADWSALSPDVDFLDDLAANEAADDADEHDETEVAAARPAHTGSYDWSYPEPLEGSLCTGQVGAFDPTENFQVSFQVREAVAICQSCPVRRACLTAAQRGEESGVWGGQYLLDGQVMPLVNLLASVPAPRGRRVPSLPLVAERTAPSLLELLSIDDLIIVSTARIGDVAAGRYALAHAVNVSVAEVKIKKALDLALHSAVPATQDEEQVLIYLDGAVIRLDLAQQMVVGYEAQRIEVSA